MPKKEKNPYEFRLPESDNPNSGIISRKPGPMYWHGADKAPAPANYDSNKASDMVWSYAKKHPIRFIFKLPVAILILYCLRNIYLTPDLKEGVRIIFDDRISTFDYIRDSLKFVAGLTIIAIVGLFEIVSKIHLIYLILLAIMVVLFLGFYAVYNPYINPTPVADLSLKGPTGDSMHITSNRNAVNVTYQQVLDFLAEDDTSVVIGRYQTGRVSGAVRLHDNAEKKGIRAGVAEVALDGAYAQSYCWNVFDTTDQGRVYVTSYHPEYRRESDSIVIIPQSGDHAEEIFFVPMEKAVGLRYYELDETMGNTSVAGKVTGINVVW